MSIEFDKQNETIIQLKFVFVHPSVEIYSISNHNSELKLPKGQGPIMKHAQEDYSKIPTTKLPGCRYTVLDVGFYGISRIST